jgi:carboxymethylenebutenolidase
MGETVTFASNGGTCTGYLALPESGRGPAVIVIQEWWGLVPHIVRTVDRFAAAGYVAFAPDFYRGERTTEPNEAEKLMLGLKVDQAAKDIAGAAAYLVSRDEVTSDKVGTVGFCMGGGLALLAGSVNEHIVATSCFYPATPWPDYHPDWTKYAGKSTIVHLAEFDDAGAKATVIGIEAEITSAGGSAQTFDYVGGHHAFFNEDRPEVYDEGFAKLAFTRTVDLFTRTLN